MPRPDIADELVVGPNTVVRHVSNILANGSSDRTEACLPAWFSRVTSTPCQDSIARSSSSRSNSNPPTYAAANTFHNDPLTGLMTRATWQHHALGTKDGQVFWRSAP